MILRLSLVPHYIRAWSHHVRTNVILETPFMTCMMKIQTYAVVKTLCFTSPPNFLPWWEWWEFSWHFRGFNHRWGPQKGFVEINTHSYHYQLAFHLDLQSKNFTFRHLCAVITLMYSIRSASDGMKRGDFLRHDVRFSALCSFDESCGLCVINAAIKSEVFWKNCEASSDKVELFRIRKFVKKLKGTLPWTITSDNRGKRSSKSHLDKIPGLLMISIFFPWYRHVVNSINDRSLRSYLTSYEYSYNDTKQTKPFTSSLNRKPPSGYLSTRNRSCVQQLAFVSMTLCFVRSCFL